MSALDNMSFFTPLDEGEQLSLGDNQLAPGLGNTSSTQATEGSSSTVNAKKPRKKLLTTQ
jgi:hypothetical protein